MAIEDDEAIVLAAIAKATGEITAAAITHTAVVRGNYENGDQARHAIKQFAREVAQELKAELVVDA